MGLVMGLIGRRIEWYSIACDTGLGHLLVVGALF